MNKISELSEPGYPLFILPKGFKLTFDNGTEEIMKEEMIVLTHTNFKEIIEERNKE